tara:strand:- start:208 stop:789 length:582 start_codon:yes stop_codon:yes gene_type:complete
VAKKKKGNAIRCGIIMKLLMESWRKFITEAQIFYHGTSDEAGQSIIQNGFSISNSGARQKALHGREVVEIGGVYLTSEKEHAKWYAGPDNTKPGMNRGGVVVEAEVVGKIMTEQEWWSVRREISQKIGGELFDDEKDKQKNEAAVNQAKEMGYVGFQENTDPNEIVIFDPQSVGAVGAFTADSDEEPLDEEPI